MADHAFEDVLAVAGDALLGQFAEGDLVVVDQRGHARHPLPLGRIVPHVFEPSAFRPLQLLEASWATVRILRSRRNSSSFGAASLEAHVLGRDQPFALQDHVLAARLDHRRNLAVGHVEHRVLDLLVASVLADRVDDPLDGWRWGRLPSTPWRGCRNFWIGHRFRRRLLRLLQIARRQSAGPVSARRTASRIPAALPRGVTFSRSPASFRSARVGQMMSLAYCSGVTFRSCLSIFSHWSTGNVEPLGHPLDLGVDLVASHRDPLPPALLDDQLLVDHALQHFLAVVAEALAAKLLAGDPLGVHGGHHGRDGGSRGFEDRLSLSDDSGVSLVLRICVAVASEDDVRSGLAPRPFARTDRHWPGPRPSSSE